jgi:membrane associated rhomboid family serine protease
MRITAIILAITVAVFITQVAFDFTYCPGAYCIEGNIDPFTYQFSLVPVNAVLHGQVWQFVTYMFLHGTRDSYGNFSALHIMFNMFVLLIFGVVVEQALGARKFITLYLVSGIGAAFLHVALTGISDIVMLGASGAVFGILAAYGFMFPNNKIIIFPIPVPLPSWIAIVGIAILEFILGFYQLESGIANFGHLGGIVTGAVLVYFWKHRKPKNVHERRNYEFFWQ